MEDFNPVVPAVVHGECTTFPDWEDFISEATVCATPNAVWYVSEKVRENFGEHFAWVRAESECACAREISSLRVEHGEQSK